MALSSILRKLPDRRVKMAIVTGGPGAAMAELMRLYKTSPAIKAAADDAGRQFPVDWKRAMKRVVLIAGGLLLVACSEEQPTSLESERATTATLVQGISDGIERLKRDRDEAVASRDYWAARAGRRCRDFKAMEIDDKTDSAVILSVEGAKPEARITVVELDSPDRSVCIVKIGAECVFGYDGSRADNLSGQGRFTSTREIRIKIGGQ